MEVWTSVFRLASQQPQPKKASEIGWRDGWSCFEKWLAYKYTLSQHYQLSQKHDAHPVHLHVMSFGSFIRENCFTVKNEVKVVFFFLEENTTFYVHVSLINPEQIFPQYISNHQTCWGLSVLIERQIFTLRNSLKLCQLSQHHWVWSFQMKKCGGDFVDLCNLLLNSA